MFLIKCANYYMCQKLTFSISLNRYRTDTVDPLGFPFITFTDAEKYAASSKGCESTAKAYKFFAEPGYLHEVKSKPEMIF